MNRSHIAWFPLLAALAFVACGQEYKLPPAPEEGRIPTAGTYNYDRTWSVPGPTDIVLHGSYLYVIEQNQRIGVYLSRQSEPRHPTFVSEFQGLVRPVKISLAQSDSSFLYVADAGDSTIKRYYFLGGPPLSAFSIGTNRAASITGLAADTDRNVFIAMADSDRVIRYDPAGTQRRLVSDHGTGYGYVIRPLGISWVDNALWVAAAGKSPPLVQRLQPYEVNTAFSGKPIGEKTPLGFPTDVTTDSSGEHVFITDALGGRVLRFAATGAFEDSVYTTHRPETAEVVPPILSPRYVAADSLFVYIPDSTNDRIVIVKLVKQ